MHILHRKAHPRTDDRVSHDTIKRARALGISKREIQGVAHRLGTLSRGIEAEHKQAKIKRADWMQSHPGQPYSKEHDYF